MVVDFVLEFSATALTSVTFTNVDFTGLRATFLTLGTLSIQNATIRTQLAQLLAPAVHLDRVTFTDLLLTSNSLITSNYSVISNLLIDNSTSIYPFMQLLSGAVTNSEIRSSNVVGFSGLIQLLPTGHLDLANLTIRNTPSVSALIYAPLASRLSVNNLVVEGCTTTSAVLAPLTSFSVLNSQFRGNNFASSAISANAISSILVNGVDFSSNTCLNFTSPLIDALCPGLSLSDITFADMTNCRLMSLSTLYLGPPVSISNISIHNCEADLLIEVNDRVSSSLTL